MAELSAEMTPADINEFNRTILDNFHANNGEITIDPFTGMRMLLLHHVGAKTGTERVNPLAYTRDGDDLVIIASKGGSPEHPAWYHNLIANPRTSVELGTETIDVTAQALTGGAERDRLYRQMAETYPNFWEYEKKTDRVIPVIVLHRR